MKQKLIELKKLETLDFNDWSKESFEKILYKKFKHLQFWRY